MTDSKRDLVVDELRRRGYDAEARNVVRNGIPFAGIVFRADDRYSDETVFYPHDIPGTISMAADAIIRMYENHEVPSLNVEDYFEAENLCQDVRIALQKESDEDICRRPSGFEGVEQYMLIQGKSFADGWRPLFKVNRGFLEAAGIFEKDAWNCAKANTFTEAQTISLDSAIRGLINVGDEEKPTDTELPIYIVTNESMLYGASAILNKRMLKKEFGEKFGVKQAFMIPSSVHETLVIPCTDAVLDRFTLEELGDLVVFVNATEVLPEERLTDRAYMINIG